MKLMTGFIATGPEDIFFSLLTVSFSAPQCQDTLPQSWTLSSEQLASGQKGNLNAKNTASSISLGCFFNNTNPGRDTM